MGQGFTFFNRAKARAGLKALFGIGMPGRVRAAGKGMIVPLGGLGNATGFNVFSWPIIVQSPIQQPTFHSPCPPHWCGNESVLCLGGYLSTLMV